MNILFISLGCDKNLVDSENMLGILAGKGHTIVDDESEAEVIVVNSCCFIGDAKEESIQTILEMAQLKETGKLKYLIVTGCLAQRYKEEVLTEIPEVDAVLGTMSYENIAGVIEGLGSDSEMEKADAKITMKSIDYLPAMQKNRLVTTGGHYAYLKIAEGCNKHCTYCIIPKVRGQYRSYPMEELVEEAKRLVDNGVKELILVAQETTLYGMDLYGKKCLPELLKKLCEIEELWWIRVLYCYPEEITDELIQTIKEEEKICNYLDLPIQHCNDDILKRMGRRTNKQQLLDMVEKLRTEIPDITLRTTLIAGFPGETTKQHQEMLDFVDMVGFERLGCFPYSPEEDTPAATMPDQVPEETKQLWRDEIMELQQDIAFDNAYDAVGEELLVMIEGKVADENAYVGRTYKDAPNVDGLIFVNTDEELMSGDFANVKVTAALEYDLIGELV